MTMVVAEIGSNFIPGDLNSAFKMIQTAAEVGADAVKFQHWRLFLINRPPEWKERCRPWEIPADWWLYLRGEAHRLGLKIFFSAFDSKAVWDAASLQFDIIKVASSEIGNQALLREINDRCSLSRVFLSVPHNRQGAAIPALTWLPDCAVTLMHCIAEYPAEPDYQSFGYLKEFGLPVGWSSHVAYPDAIFAAAYFVNAGATVVEAHIRDDSDPLSVLSKAPDNGPWSLYPSEFAELVKAVKDG